MGSTHCTGTMEGGTPCYYTAASVGTPASCQKATKCKHITTGGAPFCSAFVPVSGNPCVILANPTLLTGTGCVPGAPVRPLLRELIGEPIKQSAELTGPPIKGRVKTGTSQSNESATRPRQCYRVRQQLYPPRNGSHRFPAACG